MNYKETALSAATVVGVVLLGGLLANKLGITLPIEMRAPSANASDFSVTAEGKVTVVPDVTTINAGIVAQGKDQGVVRADMDKVNNAIIAAVKTLGIDKKDIQSSNYSIYPNYDYTNGRNTITGYQGNASVTIKVRGFDKQPELAGKVMQAVTAAGANQVQNQGFTVDDMTKYQEEARSMAIKNAKDKAQKLASELGIRLGSVTNMVEDATRPSMMPMYAMSAKADMGGAAEPAQLEGGSQDVTSTVTLFFERK